MKFVVITIAEAEAHGIKIIPTMRRSVDNTQVVLHEEYIRNIDEFNALKRYEYDSPEFTELMESEEWTHGEDYARPSEDYAKVKAIQILTKQTTESINAMNLSDKESLSVKEFYPEWREFVGKSLEKGSKARYKDKLYKVRQNIPSVLENQPPSVSTAALYEEVVEGHAGTKEDPIPYNEDHDPEFAGMTLEKGRFYTQDGVVYECWNGSGIAVYADLKDLTTFVRNV